MKIVRSSKSALSAVLLLLLVLLGVIAPSSARGAASTRPSAAPPAGNLPVICLEAREGITAEKAVAFTASWLSPVGGKIAVPGKWCGTIRIRGATSQSYPKKSFALVLDSPSGFMQFPARRHWILNAAYIDRSLMRHKIAYDLFRSLSTPAQPRHASGSRFVEVRLNDAYNGVYLLQERVDAELLGHTQYVKGDVAHACLYKAADHAAGFVQAGHGGFAQVEPDPVACAYWEPLDALTKLVHSASAAAFWDPKTGIAAQLDLDNAIDFHLLVLVTGNADGITKNFNLGRPRPESGAATRFFFVPWDYDGTIGRNWDASPLSPEYWLSNGLFERLMQDPAYRQRFAARWQQLRQNEFSAETIQRMIDANAQTLGPAARRNAQRWPTTAGYYPDRLSFDQDVAQMKTWIAARVRWLDGEIVARTKARNGRYPGALP